MQKSAWSQLATIKNLSVNSLTRNNAITMAVKIWNRFKGVFDKSNIMESTEWCKSVAIDCERYCSQLNSELWNEARRYSKHLNIEASQKTEHFNVQLGGGGHDALLYFITRYIAPSVVVETGVGAGFSTSAILAAIKKNKHGGHLYSSDFPYFRIKDPEKYIGCIVDEKLKENWSLYIDGDKENLKKILKHVANIDLFHYDSDKSYYGRDFVLSQICPHISNTSVIVIDDINDNQHFRQHVERTENPYLVFEYNGKYVGLIGRLEWSF